MFPNTDIINENKSNNDTADRVQKDLLSSGSVGRVTTLKDGIVTVIGLSNVKAGEIIFVMCSNVVENVAYIKALVLNLNVENNKLIQCLSKKHASTKKN